MTLFVGTANPGSPITAVDALTRTPAPALLVIMFPPGRLIREWKAVTPKRPKAPVALAPLPEMVLPAITAAEVTVTWMPVDPLPVIASGASVKAPVMPIRALLPLKTSRPAPRSPRRCCW